MNEQSKSMNKKEHKDIKSTNSDKPQIKWGGFLNEFLWICAGVNRKVLRQCPTDYAKYAGIGGTILFTALMAMLSGGYALFTVFDNQETAIAFGIFWGLLIFNLDRFIVNTMYSDGKVTISWREFYCGLPRIIMAVFLGIVISTPLELKIFEDAIDIRIEQDKDSLMMSKIKGVILQRDSIAQKRDDVQNGVVIFDSDITTGSSETNKLLSEHKDLMNRQAEENLKLNEINASIARLQKERAVLPDTIRRYKDLSVKIANYKKQKSVVQSNVNAIIASIRVKNGEIAASDGYLKDLMRKKQDETLQETKRLQGEVDSINRIISEANTRHPNWSEKEIKTKGSFRDKLDVEYKGFQAKMKAFSELKDESPSTKISSIFIMLLFVIIETAPTFFKMMIASGPYDDLLRSEMHSIKVLADKRISDINDNINTEVQISTQKNQARLEAEVLANNKVLEQIASVQAELLQTAIEKWRKQELAKIAEDPSAYIKQQ